MLWTNMTYVEHVCLRVPKMNKHEKQKVKM